MSGEGGVWVAGPHPSGPAAPPPAGDTMVEWLVAARPAIELGERLNAVAEGVAGWEHELQARVQTLELRAAAIARRG